MKKILIAVAIVCAAVMTQAATANWAISAANIFVGDGTATRYTGAAFVFNADTLTQSALFDLFNANQTLDLTAQSGYLASGSVANGVINATLAANKFGAFEQGSGDHNFYFVLVNDDKMFLSKTQNVSASATDTAVSITFGSQMTGSKLTTEGFSATGQWAQVVPEPTSGLLLLIGMGALALRRKRA